MPFELPDNECIRMNRHEVAACRMVMALMSNLMYAREDLKARMETVPGGPARMDKVVTEVQELFQDIIGTVSDRQRKQLRNIAQDCEIQLIPKLTHSQNRVLIPANEVREIVDMAREKCRMCTDSDAQARKCRLYQWLEVNIPLEDYGSGLMCPYSNIDWE